MHVCGGRRFLALGRVHEFLDFFIRTSKLNTNNELDPKLSTAQTRSV